MPRVSGGNVFGNGVLSRRVRNLKSAERSARQAAAREATKVTDQYATRVRPDAPPRPGRENAGLKRNLRWMSSTVRSEVYFDQGTADALVPYWIIQEIGTGQRGTLKRGMAPDDFRNRPLGRPTKGSNRTRAIKSQLGRRISAGLVWADRSGTYQVPSSSRYPRDQIFPASTVLGVVTRRGNGPSTYRAGIRIGREIQGKHMVKKGGEAGFRQYYESVLAAARREFGGFPKP